MKRLFDILISSLCLFIALPLSLLIAIAIKLESKGPVIFSTKRMGWNGILFKIFKFRTMTVNSNYNNLGITSINDVRVTRVGKILRRVRLDEIPQLINILKGDMSIVGPRPEDPKYVRLFEKDYKKILSVRPGCVSPGWIKYRDEVIFKKIIKDANNIEERYIKEVLPKKIFEDTIYINNMSFVKDITIILKAILSLVSK